MICKNNIKILNTIKKIASKFWRSNILFNSISLLQNFCGAIDTWDESCKVDGYLVRILQEERLFVS